MNYRDQYWLYQKYVVEGLSRKQVGEMLGGLDRVEEQLARDYTHVDQLILIIEGVIVPVDDTHVKTVSWQGARPRFQGKKFGNQEPYTFNYYGYRKWLNSVRQWGIEVIEVPTREALINELVAGYTHSQTAPEDHQTFKRAIRPKFDMPTADPQLLNLMSLHDEQGRTFIGMISALALQAAGFGSLYSLANAQENEIAAVDGFGRITAKKIKRSINGA